jgi:hypothetical protein
VSSNITENDNSLIYIGSSGSLNTKLHSLLEQSGIKFKILSAREPLELCDTSPSSNQTIIFGGRKLGDWQNIFNELNPQDKIIYLSTYLGNSFYDAYQKSKKNELEKIYNSHPNVVFYNIPFIEELLPLNVKLLLNRKLNEQGWGYLSMVSLDEIVNSIKSEKSTINTTKKHVYLSRREKALWLIYSKFYRLGNLSNSTKLLTIIKIAEKLSHLMLRTSGLSCVFIQKES